MKFKSLLTIAIFSGLLASTGSLHAQAHKKSDLIYCTKTGTTKAGNNSISFKRKNCGGELPGPRYKGAISLMHVSHGTVSYGVTQPAPGKKAGIYFWANRGGKPYHVGALFHKFKKMK